MVIMIISSVIISEILGKANILSRFHLNGIVPVNVVESCLARGVISHVALIASRVYTSLIGKRIGISIIVAISVALKGEGSIRRRFEGGH